MSRNENFHSAKKAKNDEFYTQYVDIEREMNAYLEYNENVFKGKTILLPCDNEDSNFTRYFSQNFERFGLKKLISTGYNEGSKGKLFTVTRDVTGDGKVDIEDLEWKFLDGDGDFRSDEVKALRDEADMIVTNPPFSLFREFLAWALEKQFIIVGSINALTCKEVFPLIKSNRIWLGAKELSTFHLADGSIQKLGNVCWYTNVEHGRRQKPLQLMTMADNLRYNKKLIKTLPNGEYQRYDNYDAIEIPFTSAIPSDYDGIMGVPISFLEHHCPDQFEIVGLSRWNDGMPIKDYVNVFRHDKNGNIIKSNIGTDPAIVDNECMSNYYTADNSNDKLTVLYRRVFIRRGR